MATNYIAASALYGFVRGVYRTSNMRHYDEKNAALPGQKIMTTVISTVLAPSLLPVYLANDINRSYIHAHGLDPVTFNYKPYDTCVTDVLFN